jgi:hypothetical protein
MFATKLVYCFYLLSLRLRLYSYAVNLHFSSCVSIMSAALHPLTVRNALEPAAHIKARLFTEKGRQINQKMQLRRGVSYEQFLTAVKAEGFDKFMELTRKGDTAILLSKSFWILLTGDIYSSLIVHVQKEKTFQMFANSLVVYEIVLLLRNTRSRKHLGQLFS